MPAVDWLEVLDIARAAANCRTDIFGDWYRDPWAWPELEWLAKNPDAIVQRLNSSGVRRLAPLNVAKENFVLRPASVLDIVDRIVFQVLVDRLSVKLLAAVPSWMFSWRLSRQQPVPGRYADQGDEWDRYRDHLIELSGFYTAALTTDIVSYFASIPPERLASAIEQKAGSGAVTDRLVDMVRSWGKVVGRAGLPQRAWGSSVLANMYLRPVDDILRQFGLLEDDWLDAFEESAAARWVDDIWLFNDSGARLREAQVALQQCMEELGLQINAGKTKLLEGDEVIEEARNIEHSAVDVGLEVLPPDTQPLSELVDKLLSRPSEAPQTSIRFVAVRIKEHQLPGVLDRFVEAAPRMPQGAPALSRLFRETGKWQELDDWYRDHVRSTWNVIEWSAAQLGTMFPAKWKASAAARDLMAGFISPDHEISLFALSAQRLAAWDSATARSILREVAPKLSDPHFRRIAGFAALNAGEESAWVGKLLGEFEENRPTLQFLSRRGFKPISPVADFQGA